MSAGVDMNGVLIYGAGGFGREVELLWSECEIEGLLPVVGFIDDAITGMGAAVAGHPTFDLATAAARFPDAAVLLAIGNGAIRLRAADRVISHGLRLGTAVSPTCPIHRSVRHGAGLVICRGSTLTVDITLGRAVQINLDCTIGHDAILADGVTLAPGVHISGFVTIEREAYLGTGAVVINGTAERRLVIGAGAIIGAGAVVTRNVESGTTVVGSPAKPIAAKSH